MDDYLNWYILFGPYLHPKKGWDGMTVTTTPSVTETVTTTPMPMHNSGETVSLGYMLTLPFALAILVIMMNRTSGRSGPRK